jgi:hypothetical protein
MKDRLHSSTLSLHHSPLHARQIHTNAGIVGQHFAAHRLPERGLAHRVRVIKGSGGQPFTK